MNKKQIKIILLALTLLSTIAPAATMHAADDVYNWSPESKPGYMEKLQQELSARKAQASTSQPIPMSTQETNRSTEEHREQKERKQKEQEAESLDSDDGQLTQTKTTMTPEEREAQRAALLVAWRESRSKEFNDWCARPPKVDTRNDHEKTIEFLQLMGCIPLENGKTLHQPRDIQRLVTEYYGNNTHLQNSITKESSGPLVVLLDGTIAVPFARNIHIIHPSTGKIIRTINVVTDKQSWERVYALAALSDGSLASAVWDNENIKIWNPETGACVNTVDSTTDRLHYLTPLSQGRFLFCNGSGFNIHDTTTATSTRCFGNPMSFDKMTQLSDNRLVRGYANGQIDIVDLTTGEAQPFATHGEQLISNLLAMPQHNKLVSSSRDGTIKIWDLNTRKCLHTLDGQADTIRSLTLLSDGNIAAGYENGIIKIWNKRTGECMETIDRHTTHSNPKARPVYGLAAVANNRFASQSFYTINIWKQEGPQELMALISSNERAPIDTSAPTPAPKKTMRSVLRTMFPQYSPTFIHPMRRQLVTLTQQERLALFCEKEPQLLLTHKN